MMDRMDGMEGTTDGGGAQDALWGHGTPWPYACAARLGLACSGHGAPWPYGGWRAPGGGRDTMYRVRRIGKKAT